MAGRIGITTDPERRKQEWEKQCPSLHNWQILEVHETKSAAREAEDRLAELYYCESGQGGNDAPGWWSVYKFDY